MLRIPYILGGFASLFTTVFPVCGYKFGRIALWLKPVHCSCATARRSIPIRELKGNEARSKGDTVDPNRTPKPLRIVSAGTLSTIIALLSSRLDRALFHILSSGSVFLAMTFGSLSIDLISRRFTRYGEPTREPTSPGIS
jgi:hypothetical protein